VSSTSGTGTTCRSGHVQIASAHRALFRLSQAACVLDHLLLQYCVTTFPPPVSRTAEPWSPCWCAAPARRALLLAMTASLGTVLPLLYDLASQHCGAAMAALQAGQQQQARPHAAVVTATLAAADAYSEWAPVPALEASRLIEAAGALLQAREFREGAADFLKHVAARWEPRTPLASWCLQTNCAQQCWKGQAPR
jgi:hypothetical protein